jgi:hypothetical protein
VTTTPASQANFRDRFNSDNDDRFGNAHHDDSENEEKKNADPTEGMTE